VLIVDIFLISDENVNYMSASSMTSSVPVSRGHKKRSRTRQRLLDAALHVVAESGEGFSLGEVSVAAGVAHGTLYNYFRDRDELMDAIVMHSAETFAARLQTEVKTSDHAVRFAVITVRALRESAATPDTMRAMLRLESQRREHLVDGPLSYLHANLVDGHKAGRFSSEIDDATIDVILGALLIAVRRAVEGEANDQYVSTFLERLLVTLGIDNAEARRIAVDAVSS